jgi:hypothetical protein
MLPASNPDLLCLRPPPKKETIPRNHTIESVRKSRSAGNEVNPSQDPAHRQKPQNLSKRQRPLPNTVPLIDKIHCIHTIPQGEVRVTRLRGGGMGWQALDLDC